MVVNEYIVWGLIFLEICEKFREVNVNFYILIKKLERYGFCFFLVFCIVN